MNRPLYRFNPETFTYERVRVEVRAIMRNLGIAFVMGVIVAATFIGYSFYSNQHVEDHYLAERNQVLAASLKTVNQRYSSLQASLDKLHQNDNSFYRSILALDRIEDGVWNGGTGGSDKYEAISPAVLREAVLNNDQMQYRLLLMAESYAMLEKAAAEKTEYLSHVPVIRPVPGRVVGGFGHRRDPFHGHHQFHPGIDFDADMGTPIKATGAGIIITSGLNGESGYGIQVEIDHGFGFITKYAHLSRTKLKIGDIVKRGDVIGYSGNTGYSTGPHLHYEVIVRGKKTNPNEYFIGN